MTARATRRSGDGSAEPASSDPVAVVAVDTGLAHLDRPFDYLIPAGLDAQVRPGVRVTVRFAGRELKGFVLERRATSGHDGHLTPLRRVVSAEPVLTPEVLSVCTAVARHCAGTLSDVLRLAIPPRHAGAERALGPAPVSWTTPLLPSPVLASSPMTSAWIRYGAGPSFLKRLAAGQAPAASLLACPTVEPGQDWPALLAQATAVALSHGRGSLIVVPDARDVARVDRALVEVLGRGQHVRLTADQGPQARYTAYLKVLRGHVRVVVGTRAAAFAPVHDLGLVAWWDDGEDSLVEQRAPYPHVRDVLSVRAGQAGAALLSAGYTRTVAVAAWVQQGRMQEIVVTRAMLRRSAPRVEVAGEGADAARDAAASSARLTTLAFTVARAGLAFGPVLVQVPRRGYLPALSCAHCRRAARCATCSGPLGRAGENGVLTCGWCGAVTVRWLCPSCSGTELRARVIGARRTAHELGRAFPSVPVLTSGGGAVLDTVDARPRLVVATPGAEPLADGGYAAALLLDAWALLELPHLAAGEEALRRWLGAAALVRGAAAGGRVVLGGAPGHVVLPEVEALVRWDPGGYAARELTERATLNLPPAIRMAALTASRAALTLACEGVRWPPSTRVLGPLPTRDGRERLLVTTDLAHGAALATEVAAVHARSVARRDTETVHVRMDFTDPAG